MNIPQPISSARLYRGPLVLLALVIVLPLCARGSFGYLLPLIQLCGIYAIIVTGLTLLIGFTGQVSLGHAGFYGLGASTPRWPLPPSTPRSGWPSSSRWAPEA